MSKIQVMSPHLANMIAAGEVIERPSSIIKELVENSIDAHSKHIEVEIYKAGREKIVVKDDGDGMDKEDAVLAFKRHASSKLLDEFQLFKIKTMGFRGEALPSIAAVSKVTLMTSNGKDVGSKVKVTEEQLTRVDYQSAKGTVIEVEELFYNTPVRLKYLKTDYTEVASCIEVMQRLALSYPDVAFDFYIDGKRSFSTSGRGDLLEVIARLYGDDIAKKMLYIEHEELGFSFKGYIAKPEVTRSNRYYMITILNKRNVYIPLVQKSIIEGYSDYIFNSKYPFVILDIKVEYSLVDVNVHPSKKEVRLSNDAEVANAIKTKIYQRLKEENAVHDVYVPTKEKEVEKVSLFQEQKDIEVSITRPMVQTKPVEEKKTPEIQFSLEELDEDILNDSQEPFDTKLSNDEIPPKTPTKQIPSFKVIGQIHKTYIVLEGEDGFYLCDQHAANERINYEKFQKTLNQHIYTTDLLVPMVFNFSLADMKRLTPQKLDILKEIGLNMEPFGPTAMKISSIPLFIKEANEETYVEELVQQVLKDDKIQLETLRKHVIATMACKASIKANDILTQREMEDLITHLFQCENPTCCPHGRPTIVHFSKYDIEKMFKRSGI